MTVQIQNMQLSEEQIASIEAGLSEMTPPLISFSDLTTKFDFSKVKFQVVAHSSTVTSQPGNSSFQGTVNIMGAMPEATT